MPPPVIVNGALWHRGFLDRGAQEAMAAEMMALAGAAPFVSHETPWGKRMSVRMTAAGSLGWVSDRAGYRYAPAHPSGAPWPPIPASVLGVWRAVSGWPSDADSCLVNLYGEEARMGMHQDRDERDLAAPVVSISLGDTGLFRVGGTTRRDPAQRIRLESGDIIVLTGPSRLAFHGIDRILPGTSTLLPEGGRLNLTLRLAG
jgi:DNA oxidative demethylase